jgi:hypothetical protein
VTDRPHTFKALAKGTAWVGCVIGAAGGLYVLSAGPMAYLWGRGVLPELPGKVFFRPLIPLDERLPAYDRYLHWWAEKGRADR